MAIKTEEVSVGICDACGRRCHSGPNGEPPEGIVGTVINPVRNADGQFEAYQWFSCKKKVPGHIGQAVRKVLDQAPGKDGSL